MSCIWLHDSEDERWCDQDHDPIDCEDCPDRRTIQDVVSEFFARER
jgi:hypothetical protein